MRNQIMKSVTDVKDTDGSISNPATVLNVQTADELPFLIDQRVRWVGPGGEEFGTVTGGHTSQSGIEFVLVRWDGQKGSLQYAKLTAEKYLECLHEYQEVSGTPFVECSQCREIF